MTKKGRGFFIRMMAIVCSILTLGGLIVALFYYI